MEESMRLHSLSPGEWGKTLAIGVGVAILTGAVMFMGLKTGVSPLPSRSAWLSPKPCWE
jgi:hypothetical protein